MSYLKTKEAPMLTENQEAIRTILRVFPVLAPELQKLLDQQPGLRDCEPFIRILAAMLAKYPTVIGKAALAQVKDNDIQQAFVYLRNSKKHEPLWLWLMSFKQSMRDECAMNPSHITPENYAHAWLFIASCAYRVAEDGRGRIHRPKRLNTRLAR